MDTNEHIVNDNGEHKSPIGGRIREERLRLGFSQAAFAKLVGVHRRTQINYEHGERKPDTDYLEAMARANVDVGYVLTGESEFRNLMVLQDICGHIRAVLEIVDSEFDAEWSEVRAKVREDVQNFYDDKPAPLQGYYAVCRLLQRSPVLITGVEDFATLLDQVEFVAEADGIKLPAAKKAKALICLYRKLKAAGERFIDLPAVREAIRQS